MGGGIRTHVKGVKALRENRSTTPTGIGMSARFSPNI